VDAGSDLSNFQKFATADTAQIRNLADPSKTGMKQQNNSTEQALSELGGGRESGAAASLR